VLGSLEGVIMSMQSRLLLLALLMANAPAYAASDPFDPELFLTPYGEVASLAVTTEAVLTEDATGTENACLMQEAAHEVGAFAAATEQSTAGTVEDDAVELALQPGNFIQHEDDTAQIIAADLASLSETTGSIGDTEAMVTSLEGYEDR
jgi:hypothetical protein